MKRSWTEPAIIWGAIIARSGTLKSPALAEATRSLRRTEADAIDAERQRRDEYKAALQQWQDASRGERGDRPAEPEPAPRLIVSDVTVEALALRLSHSPGGLLLFRDELAGWIRGFDQYKGGKGADAQAWLEMHRAGNIIVDRRSGDTLSVRRAAVSIIGTVQPEVLRDALRGDNIANGLAARLLFVMPPERPKRWSDADVAAGDRIEFGGLLEELRDLAFAPNSTQYDPRPVDLLLSPEAHEAFIGFYNMHARREADAPTDALAAALLEVGRVRRPLGADPNAGP